MIMHWLGVGLRVFWTVLLLSGVCRYILDIGKPREPIHAKDAVIALLSLLGLWTAMWLP